MLGIGGGEAVGALSMFIPPSHSVADMEALACQRAVQFVVDIGLQRVIFGGDLTMVISALNQGDAEFASYGNITEDIRCKAANFQSFDFNHVSRSCNCVADALAKKSSKQAGASRVAARATCRHCSFTVI